MTNRKKLTWFLLGTFIGLAAITAFLYYSGMLAPNTLKPGNYTTEVVDRGRVISAIYGTGIVESENEVVILSPGTGLIQSILAEPGTHVNPGDVILQLDPEGVKNEIENIKDQLKLKRNNLERNRLNARSTRLDLEYNEEVKKLRIISLKSQLVDQQQLLEVGGISPERIDQTKQEITLAEKDMETLTEKNSIRLQQLEIEEEGLLLQISLQKKTLKEKEALLQKMDIRAPSSGIILAVNGQKGEKVSTDKLLIRMSNLSSFKISGSIEEQYAKQLNTGDKVLVSIEEEQLGGTIGNITPMVENSKIQFNVHLEESSHPKLIANQQVQIQFIKQIKDDVLRIKKLPGFEKNPNQKRFVVQDNKAVLKEFTLGLTGTDHCEVLSGLQEGDIVITEGINVFRNTDEIEIQK